MSTVLFAPKHLHWNWELPGKLAEASRDYNYCIFEEQWTARRPCHARGHFPVLISSVVLQIQTHKASTYFVSKATYWCLNRGRRRKLIKEKNKGAQAAEFGRLQIYHPAMEWKKVLLVWRVGFHFSLIQCEVFKTWVWFGEINGKPRLFPLRLTPLCILIYNNFLSSIFHS